MPDDIHVGVLDALLRDGHPWVTCRAVREHGEVVDLEYVFANEAAVAAIGVGPLMGARMLRVVPEVRDAVFPTFIRVLATGRAEHVRLPGLTDPARPQWTARWIEYDVYASPGDVLVVHWRDATGEQQYEDRLQALVEHASDIVSVTAGDGTLVYVSPAIERVLGRPFSGGQFDQDIHPDDATAARAAFERVASGASGTVVETELRVRHVDGHWVWVHARATNHIHDPAVAGVVINWRDISSHRALQEELRHQALHDALTGLPNRRLLGDHLELALARTDRHDRWVAVMFCDVDHFKTVNDTFGHAAGDDLLRAVADRLSRAVRPQDTVARMGGDEFVVLCEDLPDPAEAKNLTQRVHATLGGTHHVAGHDVPVTVTIGVTTGRCPTTAEALLSAADGALYRAKRLGRNRWESA